MIDDDIGDFVDVGNELINSSVVFTLFEVIAVETIVIYIYIYIYIYISHHFELLSKIQVGIPSDLFVGFGVLDVVIILESLVIATMVAEHSSMVKLPSAVVDSLMVDVSFVAESLIKICKF